MDCIALVVGPSAMEKSEENALFCCSLHVLDLFKLQIDIKHHPDGIQLNNSCHPQRNHLIDSYHKLGENT